MSLIIPANSLAGGYVVDNSLRFNDGSSDNLTKTLGTPTSTRKCSISFWVKLSNLSEERSIFEHRFNDGTNKQISLYFSNSDNLQLQLVTGGSYDGRIYTSQLFRDVSAWYHVLIAIDTTLATSGDRLRMYVNGNEVTSFSTELQPSQNYDMHFTSGQTLHIGKNASNSAYYDGYMAEYVFIDGQALTPDNFGEFDEDSGIWKPIPYAGTYGTNGFYLEFQNSGALGTDTSGNGNNFTVNNLTSIDQTTDTPTNNFTTMNPLHKPTSNPSSYANGNTTLITTASGSFGGVSTLGVTQGKWYAEFKKVSQDSGTDDDGYRSHCGVTYITNADSDIFNTAGYYILIGTGRAYNGATDLGLLAGTSYISDNGILQIALDLDNNRISFGFNGGWMDGSAGWTNSTPTNFITLVNPASTESGYFFYAGDSSGLRGYTTNWNFGNPPYSANGYTDGAGYGNFSYAVPSGYYSLCTKNLAEFG